METVYCSVKARRLVRRRFRRRYQHIRSTRYRDTLSRIRKEAMRLYRERTESREK